MPYTDTSLLVVDDEENNRDILSRRLQREGYAVAVADSGASALEMMQVEHYDLVLLDIMMPKMDGYQVLEHINAQGMLKNTSVIMISALSDRDTIAKCLSLGARDFITKPFEITILKSRIWQCFTEHQLPRDSSRVSRDDKGANILIIDDDELNRDLLLRRISRTGHIAYSAENGVAALDFLNRQAVDLILLDIMMARMDGYQVLKEIRANEKFNHVPIIMISALGEAGTIVKCMELGADDFVVKPFNAIMLKTRITSMLAAKKVQEHDGHKKQRLDEMVTLNEKLNKDSNSN